MEPIKLTVKQGEKDEDVEAVAIRLFRWGYRVQKCTEKVNNKQYKSIVVDK